MNVPRLVSSGSGRPSTIPKVNESGAEVLVRCQKKDSFPLAPIVWSSLTDGTSVMRLVGMFGSKLFTAALVKGPSGAGNSDWILAAMGSKRLEGMIWFGNGSRMICPVGA